MSHHHEALTRSLTVASQGIFTTAVGGLKRKESEESLSMVLQAIKLARVTGKISEQDATELKQSLVKRTTFPQAIVAKLSKIERTILLEFENEEVEESADDADDLAQHAAVEQEVTALKSQCSSDDATLCWCCHDVPTPSPAAGGLFCAAGHFQCSSCLTLWTACLNEQKFANSDMFRERGGQVSCKYNECSSAPYPRAAMAAHLTDQAVSEAYLQGLAEIEMHLAQQLYNDRLAAAIREAKEEIESRHGSPRDAEEAAAGVLQPAIAAASDPSQSASASSSPRESAPTRAELEALAESLRMQLPDARMCPNCSFGPIIHRACDDLQAHQGDGGINNACPQCAWFGASWSDWVKWNGYFPDGLNQGAFNLGSGEQEAGPPVVLSPQEAKKQRLLLLEKAQEARRVAAEAERAAEEQRKQARNAGQPAKPSGPDLSKMTPAEVEAHLVLEERKRLAAKLREDRLRQQKERELTLARIKQQQRDKK